MTRKLSALSSQPSAPVPASELTAKVEHLTRKVETLLDILGPVVTRRRTVTQQAKAAGVSRVTLWRRRKKAAAQLALHA